MCIVFDIWKIDRFAIFPCHLRLCPEKKIHSSHLDAEEERSVSAQIVLQNDLKMAKTLLKYGLRCIVIRVRVFNTYVPE